MLECVRHGASLLKCDTPRPSHPSQSVTGPLSPGGRRVRRCKSPWTRASASPFSLLLPPSTSHPPRSSARVGFCCDHLSFRVTLLLPCGGLLRFVSRDTLLYQRPGCRSFSPTHTPPPADVERDSRNCLSLSYHDCPTTGLVILLCNIRPVPFFERTVETHDRGAAVSLFEKPAFSQTNPVPSELRRRFKPVYQKRLVPHNAKPDRIRRDCIRGWER